MLSMRGLVVLALVLSFAGCGGGGRALSGNPSAPSASSGGRGNVTLALVIPSQGASAASATRKPATISPSTQSISITVNGGAAQIFNVSSCSGGATLTCSLSVGAPYGLDTFLIETYSSAGGTALNAAAATLNVTTGGSNNLSVTAGNIVYVTTNADTGSGSLRAAITGAASGVTTAVLFQGVTGTITLASPIPIAQSVAIIGPGASALSISGGGATQLFTVSSGQSAVIFGLTLTRGFSNVSGGAVSNSGTLSIYSSSFTSNTANNPGTAFGFGGAIVNSGTLIITGGTFTGNSAIGPASYGATGGAIDSVGDATIDSSTFTNNSATSNGGGTYGGAIGMTDFNTTGLVITNSQFFGNSAGGSNASYNYGGAIFDSSGDILTLAGDTFGKSGAGNTSSGANDSYGGAIATYSSPNYTSITMSGTNTFAYNTVSSASTTSYSGGGAISDGGDLLISGTNTFTNNSVNAGPNASTGGYAAGGAINDAPPGCSGSAQISIAGTTTFANNGVSATDSLGNAVGGAINYVSGIDACSIARRPTPDAHRGTSLKPLVTRTLPVGLVRASRVPRAHPLSGSPVYSIANAAFTNNTASGGAASNYGTTGGALEINTPASLTIAASTFSGNAVSAGQYANGGAVAVYDGSVTLTGVTASGNTATGAGGGLQVVGGTLDLEQSVVSSNSVTGDTTQDTGGGIVDFGSSLIVNQSTVSGNALAGSLAASGGGGISILNGATATLTNSTIANNSSTINGGGIFVDGSAVYGYATATFVNLTVYQNTASASSGNGGNIDVQASGNSVTIGNSIVAGGSAANGDDYYDAVGALYIDSGNNLFSVLPSLIPPPQYSPSTAHLTGDSPQLSSAGLASNGGPTPTIADTSGSPGKGYIPFSSGLCNGLPGTSVDQRGLSRGVGRGGVPAGFCDIGAYEYP